MQGELMRVERQKFAWDISQISYLVKIEVEIFPEPLSVS